MSSEERSHIPLVQKLAIESAAAIAAAALVSPFISIIDVSIFSNASGRQKLGSAIVSGFKKLTFHPIQFCKHPSFYLIWGVYSGTYIVANTIQAFCDHKHIPWFYPKFVGTSVANVGLSVLKDLYLTRTFGTGQVRKVPFRSYSLYTIRDSLTIYASFNLPTILSQNLVASGIDPKWADVGAQLVTPCAIQLSSSPLHLLGMDFYNRPQASTPDRVVFIKKEYFATTLARIGRIFPAYGIGGVANKYFRKLGSEWLDQMHSKKQMAMV